MSNLLTIYSAANIETDLQDLVHDCCLYVDVPGLGLVNVSVKEAKATVKRLHESRGADRFILQETSRSVKDAGLILSNYY